MLEPFLGKSEYANHGQRVVEGQRLTQAASDIMLGWIRAEGIDHVKRDFYVRQLWDAKGSALVELMEPNLMTMYARVCGTELARSHARSGDAIAIASYLGNSNDLRPRYGPSSPKPTPTKTNATTQHSPTPSRPERSKPKPAYSGQSDSSTGAVVART